MTRQLRLAQKIYSGTVKLGISDLLSNEDYESQRAELLRLATLHRRQRRLRLNPSLSLVFETRFTAWLQIQEELRWLTHPSDADIAEVLARCNVLVTYPTELSATLFADGGDNPVTLYWIECIAANAFSVALRLSGRALRGRLRESSTGELAAVHTLIFKTTACCGPTSEIVWGDNAAEHTAPLSAMTRHVLAQDLNPARNGNCFVAPAAVKRRSVTPANPTTVVGPLGLAQPRCTPLRVVMRSKPESGGDSR